jgi:hypothetical protein
MMLLEMHLFKTEEGEALWHYSPNERIKSAFG